MQKDWDTKAINAQTTENLWKSIYHYDISEDSYKMKKINEIMNF